jgi:hypothetical protein
VRAAQSAALTKQPLVIQARSAIFPQSGLTSQDYHFDGSAAQKDCKKLTSIWQDDVTGMKATLCQVLGRCAVGKGSKVVNEMSLVKVAAA